MACPRCGTDCHCSPATSVAGAHVAVLIDPDRYDRSEEQFYSSLDTTAVANSSPTRGSAQGGFGFSNTNIAVAVQEEAFYRPRAEAVPEEDWRGELNDRLSTYRSRRRRTTHASMRFAFEPEAGDNRSPEELAREAARAKRKPERLGAFVEEAAMEAAALETAALSAAVIIPPITSANLNLSQLPRAAASLTAPAVIPNISFAPDRGGHIDIVYQFMAVQVKPLPGSDEDDFASDETLEESFETEISQSVPEAVAEAVVVTPLPVTVNPPIAAGKPEKKLIEFPRAVEPVAERSLFDELAEPVIQTPRILEAEPEPLTTEPEPSFAQITLDPHDAYDPYLAEEEDDELKVVPATLHERAVAFAVDALVAVAASVVFAVAAWKVGHPQLETKTAIGLAMVVPALLWAAYQIVMLAYADRTLGMVFANLRLVSFEGKRLNKRARSGRALAMILSAGSAGLGLLWSKIDVDELCWHDRITKSCEVRR